MAIAAPARRLYRLTTGIHGRFEDGKDTTYVAPCDILLTDAEASGASLKGRITLVTDSPAAPAALAALATAAPADVQSPDATTDDATAAHRWDFVWETSIADLTELIHNTTDRDELAAIAEAEDRNPNDARLSVRRLVDARVKKLDRLAEEAAALAAAGDNE